ncbi:MAG: sugar-binding protein [Ruminococcus sp.]|nr:sugar-binding protein [Ruminococcus sp.]
MKRILAIIASLSISIIMCACAGSADPKKGGGENNSGADEPVSDKSIGSSSGKTVGIALPSEDILRWKNDGTYLKQQFETAGFNVELRYSENDDSRQNADIDEMISGKVDLLLVAAVDGSTLSQTLDKAVSSDIPVIAYDRLITDTDAVSFFVSFDDYAVGRLQGEFVRDRLQLDSSSGPFNIEFIAGDPTEQSARRVFDGAFDALKPYFDEGKLVIPSDRSSFEKVAEPYWSTDSALNDMKEALDSCYSDGTILDAALCSNDSLALGAVQAIGSEYSGSNKPIVTGQGGDIENLRNIVDGTQTMTVYKNPTDEAHAAFEICKAVLSGQTPDGVFVDSLSVKADYDTDSYDNNKKKVPSCLVSPSVINKDNLQLLVDTGLYEWDSENKYLLSTEKKQQNG